MKKGSRLYSIFHNKCPKCQEGDFFVSGSAYNLGSFMKMYPQCSKCGQTFEPEPGYYFGAMYVSYAINVAIMVAVWVASEVLGSSEMNVWWVVFLSIAAGLICTPLTFRLARLTWINFFVKYDQNALGGKSSGISRSPIL